MKNTSKYLVLSLLVAGLMLSARLEAATDITLTTYYPAPFGKYEKMRLYPRADDLTGTCDIGSLYVNSQGSLQLCRDNAGVGTWGPLTEVWTQSDVPISPLITENHLFLTDTLTDPQLRVGIGTTTPTMKFHMINHAGIMAKGTFGSGTDLPNGLGAGSRLIWYPKKGAFRAGYVDGTQWDNANIGIYSVAFGRNTTASGDYSNVYGGESNVASGDYSAVSGGQSNTASGYASSVIGGLNNMASGQYAAVMGGRENVTSANYSAIFGGYLNRIDAAAEASTILGGKQNYTNQPYSFLGGGANNTINFFLDTLSHDGYSVIGGGRNNMARHNYTVVMGGQNNIAVAPYASIGAGHGNIAGVAGGDGADQAGALLSDPVNGSYSRISGGQNNKSRGDYSVVSGGQNNIVSLVCQYCTVGGGLQNSTSGDGSTVAGGARNGNSRLYAIVVGGSDNFTAGDYSLTAGKNMRLQPFLPGYPPGSTADRTFMWGYSDTPVAVSTSDAFIIAPGTLSGAPLNPSVGIRTKTPSAVLDIADAVTSPLLSISNTSLSGGAGNVLTVSTNYFGVNKPSPSLGTHRMQFGNANDAYLSGGGVWTNASSRKFKENIIPLSSQDAENAVEQLAPVTFNYKLRPDQSHVGFIAEDVPDLVAMKDRKALSSMDIIAVLTKTIQDQEKKIKNLSEEIKAIERETRSLEKGTGK